MIYYCFEILNNNNIYYAVRGPKGPIELLPSESEPIFFIIIVFYLFIKYY